MALGCLLVAASRVGLAALEDLRAGPVDLTATQAATQRALAFPCAVFLVRACGGAEGGLRGRAARTDPHANRAYSDAPAVRAATVSRPVVPEAGGDRGPGGGGNGAAGHRRASCQPFGRRALWR